MLRKLTWLTLAVGAITLIALSGCDSSPTREPVNQEKPPQTKSQTTEPAEEHPHKPGAHSGIIVEIGRDNYHAEAVFEKGGIVRLYTLGKDEAKVIEVEAQTLTAYVRPEGDTEATSFLLSPEPQPGDGDKQTSQFVGKLPKELWGKNLEVTIPSIKIAGERFRLGFKSATEAHGEDLMPTKVAEDEERKLYLTSAGKYTAADIAANGNVTASEKFKGFRAKHDLKPQPGDKICPVTLTKANPLCTWVIGGKTYEFCCPPCVDEFVKTAKETPELVKEPEDYVKK